MKGTNWFSRNFKTIIYIAFLVPIITVAIVSISHVTGWYGISNPMSWALYLSIGIEIAALSALAAISVNMGSKVYVPFGIVTIIQFVGNIFFAFEYIDIASTQFLSWVDLTGPILEYVGVEEGNLQSHRRFLAIFSGGMLPLISLSFLHMLVKFNEERTLTSNSVTKDSGPKEEPIQASDLVGEIARYRPTTEELDKLNDILSKPKTKVSDDSDQYRDLQKEEETKSEYYYDTERNKTPDLPNEDEVPPEWLDEGPEPTEEEYGEWDEDHALDLVMNDMVKDFTEEDINEIIVNEPETVQPEEDINEIIVNEPETLQPEEDININNSSTNLYDKVPQHVNGVPIKNREEKSDDGQLPDVVESAELNLDTGKIEEVEEEEPQVKFEPIKPKPNFIFKEPIKEESEDDVNVESEKKK